MKTEIREFLSCDVLLVDFKSKIIYKEEKKMAKQVICSCPICGRRAFDKEEGSMGAIWIKCRVCGKVSRLILN